MADTIIGLAPLDGQPYENKFTFYSIENNAFPALQILQQTNGILLSAEQLF